MEWFRKQAASFGLWRCERWMRSEKFSRVIIRAEKELKRIENLKPSSVKRSLQTRALALKAEAFERGEQGTEAIICCREARKRGMEAEIFFNLPCRSALASNHSLTLDQCRDLADALCSWNGLDGPTAEEIGERLRSEITAQKDALSARWFPILSHIDQHAPQDWYWVHVLLAEIARLQKEWPAALEHLEHAQDRVTDPAIAARLRWCQAHVMFRVSGPDAAVQCLPSMDDLKIPTQPKNVRLMAALVAATGDRGLLRTLVRGMKAVAPEDSYVHSVIRRAALRDPGYAEDITTCLRNYASRYQNRPIPIEFLITMSLASVRSRADDVALDCARRISAHPVREEVPERLLVLAALIRRTKNEDATAILDSVSSSDPELLGVGHALRLLEAVENLEWNNAQNLTEGAGTWVNALPGDQWRSLSKLLCAHTLLHFTKLQELFSLLENWTPRSKGERESFLWIADSALMRCSVHNIDRYNPQPKLISRGVVDHVRERELASLCQIWNRNLSEKQAARGAFRRSLMALERLSPLHGVWALWCGILSCNDTASSSADFERRWSRFSEQKIPVDWRGLMLSFCWRPGSRAWQSVAHKWVRSVQQGPGRDAVGRAVARAAAQRHDWQKAQKALRTPDLVPAGILRELGASEDRIAVFSAWFALSNGNPGRAFREGMRLIQQCKGRVDSDLLSVTFGALACADAVPKEQAHRLIQFVDAKAARGEDLARGLPPRILARWGAWHALRAVMSKNDLMEVDPGAGLRGHALLGLECAYDHMGRGDPERAAEEFWEAAARWAVWLSEESNVSAFLRDRLSTFRVSGDSSSPSLDGREVLKAAFARASEYFREAIGTSDAWKTMWELEVTGAALCRQVGGDSCQVFGPIGLSAASSCPYQVRQQIVNRARGETLEEAQKVLSLLRRLLEDEDEDFESLCDDTCEDAEEVERIFSPFGPAWLFLHKGRAEQALRYLELLKSGPGTQAPLVRCAIDRLKQLAPARGTEQWMQQQRAELVIACHKQVLRSLVAVSPMDLQKVEEAIDTALSSAQRDGGAEQMCEAVCEMAVGRAKTLWEKRTRAERLADDHDHRSNTRRREEALELLRLVWLRTGHSRVQGPFCGYLNQAAVIEAEADRYGAGTDLLAEAVSVKHNDPHVQKNLPAIIVAAIADQVDTDPRAAVYSYRDARQRVKRAQARSPNPRAFDRVLEKIKERAEIPFFNRFTRALKKEDLRTAHDYAIGCLEIFPQDEDLRTPLRMLMRGLERKKAVEPGYEAMIEELRQKAPEEALKGSREEEVLQDLLGEMLGKGLEVMKLNADAVEAANEERFEEAMSLLERARRIDPDNEIVAQNRERIGQAWMMHMVKNGDLAEFLENPLAREIMRDVLP